MPARDTPRAHGPVRPSAPLRTRLEPTAHTIGPERERPVELFPRRETLRRTGTPAIDAGREKIAGERVAKLALDRRGIDELLELGPERTRFTAEPPVVLGRRGQHVDDGVECAGLGDREP